jgi:hypothetical protein
LASNEADRACGDDAGCHPAIQPIVDRRYRGLAVRLAGTLPLALNAERVDEFRLRIESVGAQHVSGWASRVNSFLEILPAKERGGTI